MTKTEMASEIARQHHVTQREGVAIFETVVNAITGELDYTGKCTISHLGTFKVKTVAARKIATKFGGPMTRQVAAHKVVKFKAASDLNQLVNL
jgi:nucleoid DNA-binding protein